MKFEFELHLEKNVFPLYIVEGYNNLQNFMRMSALIQDNIPILRVI